MLIDIQIVPKIMFNSSRSPALKFEPLEKWGSKTTPQRTFPIKRNDFSNQDKRVFPKEFNKEREKNDLLQKISW